MSVEDVVNQSRTRLAPLLAPLDGEGGVGADISYDFEFETMKAEVDKLQAIEGGKLDWPGMISRGSELLSLKSKDFRVALYYAAGTGVTGGLRGVLDGLVLIRDLMTAFWEPMYPPLKRPRARGNLVGWYADIVAPTVQGLNPSLGDREMCLAVSETVKDLDSQLRDKLGEAYPGMGLLFEGIRALVGRLPPEPPPPPAPGTESIAPPPMSRRAPASTPMVAGGGGPTADDITDVDAAFRILRETAPLFAKAGDVILQANEADSDGFRFCRIGAWMMVSAAPENQSGATQIEGPAESLRQILRELAAAQNWQGLANEADLASVNNPYWLDPLRHLLTAFDNLGETHQAARLAVVGELTSLMIRAPSLVELTFSDGSPFADDDTKGLLAGLAAGGGGGGGAVARTAVDRAATDARKAAAEGQVATALALLTKAIANAPSGAQRFKGRLELAKICLEGGLNDMAMAQLEGLEKVAEQHALFDWDPQMCADLYSHLYRARREVARVNNDPDIQTKLSASFERLCQLDANEALRLSQG